MKHVYHAGTVQSETGNYDGIPEYICEYTKEFYRIMKEGARIC